MTKKLHSSCFDGVYNSSAYNYFIVDAQGCIHDINPGLEQLLGYSADDVRGTKLAALLSAGSSAQSDTQDKSLVYFLNNPQSMYSARLLRCDGTVVSGRLIFRPTEGTDPVLAEFIDDTGTAFFPADETAPDSFLENVFSTTGDGLYVTDELGYLVKANPALAGMLGYTQDELLGKHPVEFCTPPGGQSDSSPEFMNELLSRGFIENHEALWRKKDGSLMQVEVKVRLLKNSAGAMIGSVGAARDISRRKLAEAALRDSELRFRVLANSATDAIVFLDSGGKIIFWNQGARDMYGYDYHEMLGKTPELIVPPERFESHEQHFMHHPGEGIDSLPRITFDSVAIHKQGKQFPVEVALSSGKAGDALFFCAIIRNITSRKRLEDALRESEERFRDLAQALPEAIMAVDSNGSIVFWNRGAQDLFGYTWQEVLGKPSLLLIPERYHKTEQEGLAHLRSSGYSSLEGRIVQGFARRKDGSEFADELTAGPWQTRQGLYYVGIIRDITERLKAEQALRESEQRFKELADALPQTVFEINREGMITFVNHTALETFGYTQADIDKGMHALHIIAPEQRMTVRDNIEKVFAGETLGGQEYLALRKDGTTFPCIIHAAAIFAGDAAVGLRGLLIDIRLRKELEEQTNTSKRLSSIAALAGGVAQDFNAMLSMILGNINLAQHQVAPEDRVAEYLAAAEGATLRAKDLTGQLVAFARGGTTLKTSVSLEKLLRESAEQALKGSRVTCRLAFPQDILPARLDEAQLRQVFINLLTNADHAMPEGGLIDIKATNYTIGPADNLPLPNGEYIKITISDQSIGILNEHLQQLFDPYFTSRQRGSGIGLATTYTIIKNHGGLITVESEFGRGTTFHIFLPAKKSRDAARLN
jgi:PAS domain S-box-containing protein